MRFRRSSWKTWLALYACVLPTASCSSKSNEVIEFSGRVTDAKSGQGIEGAFVLIDLQGTPSSFMGQTGCMGGGAYVRTDKEGGYSYRTSLKEATTPPYPASWGAEIHIYMPGWKAVTKRAAPVLYPPKESSISLAPDESSFSERTTELFNWYEHLCEFIPVERGHSAFRWAIFDEMTTRYCSGDASNRLDYKTFSEAYNMASSQAALALQWSVRPWNHSGDGLAAFYDADQQKVRSSLSDYPWPVNPIATDAPDFTTEQKRRVCEALLTLKPRQ